MSSYGPGYVVALFRVIAFLLFVAAMGAMALGKISFYVGAAGLVGVLVVAWVSGSLKKRQLRRAIEESDR